MKSSKSDLRVRMTNAMLRRGFMELMVKKPIQNITISEICDSAGVNRSTFYSHYTDIYDLLESIEDEMYDEFRSTLNEVVFICESTESQVPMFMYAVFDFLKRNSEMCVILLSDSSHRHFVEKMFDDAKEKSMTEYIKAYPQISSYKIELFFTFAAAGCMGLLELWLKNGMKETPHEMADAAGKLISHGVGYFKLT